MDERERSAKESVLQMSIHTRDAAQKNVDRLATELHTPERANREGDQPLPTVNDLPCIQDLVIKDIEQRKEVGRRRYGTVLQPFNGRNSLLDAYQEALDLAIYLRQLLEEQSTPLSPAEHNVIEVCLGCGKPSSDRDCGCPAGTGLVKIKEKQCVHGHKHYSVGCVSCVLVFKNGVV